MNTKNTMTREDYENIIEFALEIAQTECLTWKRLDYCSAWVAVCDNYIFLKSYNTIVAFYNKNTGFLFDFLRVVYGYTSTSAHHISKFRNMLDVKKTIRIDTIVE